MSAPVHYKDCDRVLSKRPAPTPTKPCPATPVDPLTGFAHAKHGNREPIRVQVPDEGASSVQAAMDWWNERAGWKLLVFSDAPEIFFDPDSGGTMWSSAPPYESCTIGLSSYGTNYLVHEFGHCLGPGHEQPCGIMDSEGLSNPAFDETLLVQVGYRDEMPPPPVFVCPRCHREFPTKKKLNRHRRLRHVR